MVLDVLPAGLWFLSFVLSSLIIISCVMALLQVRSADASGVRPVGFRMVWCHIWSVCCAAGAYFAWALYGSGGIDADVADFYRSVGLVSAVAIVVINFVQLALLYTRALKAANGQMDRRLANVSNRARHRSENAAQQSSRKWDG